MTQLHIERETLDGGYPIVFQDLGARVRMAYDPEQTTEAEALAILYVHIPRLVDEVAMHHLSV